MLEALRGQTLPREQWEIIVVDNGSRVPLRAARPRDQEPSVARQREAQPRANEGFNNGRQGTKIDLNWHSNARIVREEELGLTYARLRGFAEAKGKLIVMVDDDNVLAPDYLAKAVSIAEEHKDIGAFGGKCLPEFEVEPEEWLASVRSGLGLRDLGEAPQLFPKETGERGVSATRWLLSAAPRAVSQTRLSEAVGKPELLKNRTTVLPKNRVTRRVTEFPDCAPIGAGMVLRRDAAAAYAASLHGRGVGLDGISVRQCFSRAVENPDLPKHRITEVPKHRAASVITDRKGDSLASGGDNDICLTVIEEGWQVGYLPQLQLTHLIPKQRMTLDYHRRMARDSMKSFILMLDQHGIRPWPAMPRWTLPLRVASDWCRVKPWCGPNESISWWGNVGMYEGRAALRSSAEV